MKLRPGWGCVLAMGLVTLGLPCAIRYLARPDAVMGMVLLLFFAVDPVLSACIGAHAGRRFQARWGMPLAFAGSFLLGAWVFFDMGEPDFVLYALVYLGLGYGAAALAWVVKRHRREQ